MSSLLRRRLAGGLLSLGVVTTAAASSVRSLEVSSPALASAFSEMAISTLSMPMSIDRAPKPTVVYVGNQLGAMTVFSNGRKLGAESFELLYGSKPQPAASLIQDHALTEQFFLVHPEKTEFVYVYLHGITDSAFQGKDIARVLFNQGHNVFSARLTGHGIDSANINRFKLEDWRRDVDEAIARARGVGQKIILVGLSTGADLAIDKAYREPGTIDGLVMLAPAIGIKNVLARLLSWSRLIVPLSKLIPYSGVEKNTQLAVRQPRKGTHGVFELYLLGRSIQERIKNNEILSTPCLFVTSSADIAIQEKWIPALQNLAPGSQWLRFTKRAVATGGKDELRTVGNKTEVTADEVPLHSGLPFSPDFIAHDGDPVAAQLDSGKIQKLDYVGRDERNILFATMMRWAARFADQLAPYRAAKVCSALFGD
jgi:esterase/lipase